MIYYFGSRLINDYKTSAWNKKKVSVKIKWPKQGQVDSAQLPPCEDCLNQHNKRANYQAAILKRCLDNFSEIPQTEGHGWMLDEDGTLNIKWMTGAPAPEAVLELLSCSCIKSCKLPSCTCIVNNFNCTNTCRLSNCKNTEQEE